MVVPYPGLHGICWSLLRCFCSHQNRIERPGLEYPLFEISMIKRQAYALPNSRKLAGAKTDERMRGMGIQFMHL